MLLRNCKMKGQKSLWTILLLGILCLVWNAVSDAEESKVPDATRIVINTSGPVAYRHRYQSNPPRIIFHFFHNTVYSRMQESIPIQKGIVKGIEASYFRNSLPDTKRPLKTLTFHLLADTTYEVFDGPHSIILVIRHPEQVPGKELATGKVMLTSLPLTTPPSEARQEELRGALQQAMAKVLPVKEKSDTPQPDSFAAQKKLPIPTQTSQEIVPTPWYKHSYFLYGIAFFFTLGGGSLFFLIQDRLLRREKTRSWEMAKRVITLKEESVSHEAHYAEAITRREEEARSLQSQLSVLSKEKETLQKEFEKDTGDLHTLARERMELSERLQAVQSELSEKVALQEDLLKELRELSARCDHEISYRRELEAALEKVKHQEATSKGVGEEKRRWTRLPILPVEKRGLPLTVEVQGPAGRLIYGYLRDLSLGGISFELKEHVELPSPLSLTLFFPKRKSGIEAEGKVIWKTEAGENSHYGVCFMDLSQNGSDLIGQFVRERLPQMREASRMLEESLKEKRSGKTVPFTFEAPHAESVALVGDFNDWDSEMHPMKKMKDGTWKAALLLPSGSYQYQFYVDGIWQVDPKAAVRLPNPFGGENSLLDVS